HLGHRHRALDLAGLLLDQSFDHLSPDLHSGTAGLGLALDSLAATTGDAALRAASLRCADLTLRSATGGSAGGSAPPRAGLLHGATGGALLFLRLYERTGDSA
ncbi:lantipeptide synthetase, partial [Streptomyces sp. TRM76130]|nr:lantipeptide synthetase [Streptomyces sp. TRM76130]